MPQLTDHPERSPQSSAALRTFRVLAFTTGLLIPAIQAAERPNIVFILVDDLRYDVFGFMDHPYVKTPHIDELARDGMVFHNAFVTTSLCSPSRASFLTGQFMHHHRVVNNSDLMPEGTQTFPQQLQASGYETAFIGKWHMGGSTDAARPGFDHWVSFRGQGTYFPKGQKLNVNGSVITQKKYMTDELTDYATDWLAACDPSKPFLLYLSHKGVHGLYDPAPRHLNRYADQPFVAPVTMAKTKENDLGKPMWVRDQRNSWHGIEFPYHGRSGQTIAEMYRHYCEMILSIDDSVGKVRAKLKDKGIHRNTLIVFTSDGGHFWGEHGLIDKRCAYEESIRIPLLACWPDAIKAGSECNALAANIDIAPTMLELAGLDVPDSIDGKSLHPLLNNPDSQANRESLLYEYYWEPAFPQTPTTFCLREDRFKLIQYHGIWDTDELYDLQSDPQERVNLIHQKDQQQRVAQMRRALHQQLRETGGLVIPLGFKRSHGSSQRRESGSPRSEFPPQFIHPEK